MQKGNTGGGFVQLLGNVFGDEFADGTMVELLSGAAHVRFRQQGEYIFGYFFIMQRICELLHLPA